MTARSMRQEQDQGQAGPTGTQDPATPSDGQQPDDDGYAAWRRQNAQWLELRLELLRLRLNRRALWLNRPLPTGARAADWLLAGEDGEAERDFLSGDPTAQTIDELSATLTEQLAQMERRMSERSNPPALRSLTESAQLSAFEEELLLLAAAPGFDAAFARGYAELHGDDRQSHATLHLALGVFLSEPTERLMAADCLMPGQPLRSLRLLHLGDEPDDGARPVLSRPLAVDERVCDYLRGVNRPDAGLLPLIAQVPAALPGEGTERTAERLVALITAQPDRWPTVNLVGSADGGARDATARACAALGRPLFALELSKLAACSPERHEAVLALLGREALLSGCAFFVDVSHIEPGDPAPAVVDRLIESVCAALFVAGPQPWSSAFTGSAQLDVVHVPPPTRADQLALWRAALGPHAPRLHSELDSLVQQFTLGPEGISAAVARAERRIDDPALGITGHELRRSCREVCTADLAKLAQLITPCHGWDDIVVPARLRDQLRELADQVAGRGQVYESWGFGARLGRGRGITALFAGPSGTGKTMAAEILAGHLEMDLYRVDLASVVNKYIGETEKNLRRVFDAAERSGALLFFDEADALFGTRTEVRDSHDRYANLEIDYLLQRMEDYAGLAVLATNRRSALDSAFLRRLRFVIDFPFPAAEDRRRIWESVFPEQTRLDAVEYGYLSRLELSGGNIRTIAVNAAFLAAAEGTAIGMAHLVRAAAREYTKLSKPISAAEFGEYHTVAQT